MKLLTIFLLLINWNLSFGTEKLLKNNWPFYFFGPFFPPNEKELLNLNQAESLLCKHIPSNCKLNRRVEDYYKDLPAPNEFQVIIKEIRESPKESFPLSGFLVHYYYMRYERGDREVAQNFVMKEELERSFVIDLKGNRTPLKNYISMGEMQLNKYFADLGDYPLLASFYRVQSVQPEPVSSEEKEYWLSFAHPVTKQSNLWFKHKTKVYGLKNSRIIIKDHGNQKDWAEALTVLRSLGPDIENKLTGERFGSYSIGSKYQKRDSLFPNFYIDSFDGEFLNLKILYLRDSYDTDLFQIAAPGTKSKVIIRTPEKKRPETYDESLYSDEYNKLESQCHEFEIYYWRSVIAEKKYPPLVFKVRPGVLMEGIKFKPSIKIEGASDPNNWEGHLTPWYEKYQKMIKERYFMRDMTDEQAKAVGVESYKLQEEFCEKQKTKKGSK